MNSDSDELLKIFSAIKINNNDNHAAHVGIRAEGYDLNS